MVKFIEKSTHNFALAFFYSVMQSFDQRIGAIETQLERLQSLREELHQRFGLFDQAYKQSLKSQLTKTVHDLDVERDEYAYVMEQTAKLWATKLSADALNIHGRRVVQVFKDYDFRTTEALVAENAKVDNMEQRFAEQTLAADLAAMGLTELNARLISTTAELKQLMAQRNEENSAIVTGEVKRTRTALEAIYGQMITYLNAVQEIMPEEGISQAAQYYNEDFKKVEQQIAQSKRKGSGSSSGGGGGSDSGGGDSGGGESGGGDEPYEPTPGGGQD